MDIVCVYYERNNKTCGNDRNCVGCRFNPVKSSLTYDEFRNEVYHWNCDSCKYCIPDADMDGIPSPCKRLDHKHFSFAKATFYSYDCGQRSGCICAGFEPKESCRWICNHWNKEYIDEYVSRISNDAVMYICIDHDWETRYAVRKIDFVNGTFVNPDGTLKWIRKEYYKPRRKTPIGYVYCNEYPDGTIEYGANKPIDWSKYNEN